MSKVALFNTLIEKTSDWDKDERFMATNDICNELSKDVKLDEVMERRICQAVLKQLDDPSNDVQSVAVKCLAVLLKKVHRTQLGEIADKLSSLLVDGPEALRDIYSIGLKTLIADVPDDVGPLVGERLVSRLLNGISKTGHDDVQKESLDNMADLLRRFGQFRQQDHEEIMGVVFRVLEGQKPVLRKKAAGCMGQLAVVMTDGLLMQLVDQLLSRIQKCFQPSGNCANQAILFSFIQTIGTVTRTVGHRLGGYIDRLIPLFLRFCGDPLDETQQSDAANELRENCFPGLESFLQKCPRESSAFLNEIAACAVGFMKYDPNYCYESGEDKNDNDDGASCDMQEDGEEEGEEGLDGDGYDQEELYGSDDDDNSWKVRKCAVRVIAAIISSQASSSLPQIYSLCANELIFRFKEREENVRVDIMNCFSFLLAATTKSEMGVLIQRFNAVGFLKAVCKQFNSNSVKTKSALLGTLRNFFELAEECTIAPFIESLMSHAQKCLVEKTQTLQLEAAQLVRAGLQKYSFQCMQSSLLTLIPVLIGHARGEWYKLTSESIAAIGDLISLLGTNSDAASGAFGQSLSNQVLAALLPLLETPGTDSEVQEWSITVVGKTFSVLGVHLLPRLSMVLEILFRRLDNEMMRLTTLKSIHLMTSSPLNLPVQDFGEKHLLELSRYCQLQNRAWRFQNLLVVHSLLVRRVSPVPTELSNDLFKNISGLLEDSDMQMCDLALRTVPILTASASEEVLVGALMSKIYELSTSSILVNPALASLVELFKTLVSTNHSQACSSGVVIKTLFQRLETNMKTEGKGSASKHSLDTLSRCIAGVCAVLPATEREAVFSRLLEMMKGTSLSGQLLALHVLGRLGQQQRLNLSGSFAEELKCLILGFLQSSTDELKSTAAVVLGDLAFGEASSYLPLIMQNLETNHHPYLMLVAMKEIAEICASSGTDYRAFLPSVLPTLINHGNASDEAVRNISAECLGIFAGLYPSELFPVLSELASDGSNDQADSVHVQNRKLTAITAIRFSLTKPFEPLSESSERMSVMLKQILPLLHSPNLELRKASLLLVNVVGHHNAHLAVPFLRGVFPALFETLVFKAERVVDLGPFKHKVDDGLPLRKAALSCVETLVVGRLVGILREQRYSLLSSGLDGSSSEYSQLDLCNYVDGFVRLFPALLGDKDDVKQQVHQIIGKLTQAYSASMIAVAESLIEPLEKSMTKKIDTESMTAPEIERSMELIRSTLRAVIAIDRINEVAAMRKWKEFVDLASRREPTATMLKNLLEETNSFNA